jgi:hypothetical protein
MRRNPSEALGRHGVDEMYRLVGMFVVVVELVVVVVRQVAVEVVQPVRYSQQVLFRVFVLDNIAR